MPIPGRPIISGNGSLTENISQYVDEFISPFVPTLPSYIRDTKDAVTRLQEIQVTKGTFLASLDIEALYTNIQHELGIQAVHSYLTTKGTQFHLHNQFILKLLRFLLTHNYFLFNSRYYLQLNGTAMGSKCAPNFANLFLGWWENTIVFTEQYEHFTNHVLFWGRFIDDVLILWDGTETLFQEFVQNLNQNHIGMSFTSEINSETLTFLDLRISLSPGGRIVTEVYRKPTSTNTLLHWQSYHPPPLKKGIPVGQYIRARRNCSDDSGFLKECETLYSRFQNRGYPKKILHKAFKRAKDTDRVSLLQSKPIKESTTIRCIGNFDNRNKQVYNILHKHWHVLQADPDFQEVLAKRPQITFRRGKNLKDHLVHSFYNTNPAPLTWLRSTVVGSHPCGRCSFCPYVQKKKFFINPKDERKYDIREFINCQTKGIIYIAQCPCPKLYVGKTIQEFRRRICQHVSSINTKADTSISRHVRTFHSGNPSCLQFWGLCKRNLGPRCGNLDKILYQEEAKWIYRLESLSPHGLNEGFTFSSFL